MITVAMDKARAAARHFVRSTEKGVRRNSSNWPNTFSSPNNEGYNTTRTKQCVFGEPGIVENFLLYFGN